MAATRARIISLAPSASIPWGGIGGSSAAPSALDDAARLKEGGGINALGTALGTTGTGDGPPSLEKAVASAEPGVTASPGEASEAATSSSAASTSGVQYVAKIS